MSPLVPTSARLLAEADALFDAGALPRARAAYERLVEQSQARAEHGLEACGRAMLARCLLRRHDAAAATDQLERARAVLRPGDLHAEARLRAAEVRLAARDPGGDRVEERVVEYLDWAEAHGDHASAYDASVLLAERVTGADRVAWYRRALDHGRAAQLDGRLGGTWHALAAALEAMERHDEALEAYKSALEIHERAGDVRSHVASRWAVGSVAARLDDWPLAQEHLAAAVEFASQAEDCDDLLALALADLARAHQEWGDDIDARHHLLRALAIGREIGLAQTWPDRWDAMLEQARALDLDA